MERTDSPSLLLIQGGRDELERDALRMLLSDTQCNEQEFQTALDRLDKRGKLAIVPPPDRIDAPAP